MEQHDGKVILNCRSLIVCIFFFKKKAKGWIIESEKRMWFAKVKKSGEDERKRRFQLLLEGT